LASSSRDVSKRSIDGLSPPFPSGPLATRPTTPIPQVYWDAGKGIAVVRSNADYYLECGDEALLNSVVLNIPEGSRSSTDSW
jgi:hypothetical protein